MKEKKAVEIIGGSDGPTAVFIAGKSKEKNPVKRVKNWAGNKKYQYNRKKAGKKVTATPHTLEETGTYIKDHYKGVEVDKNTELYQEKYREIRSSLILQHRPDLIGGPLENLRPENVEDEEALLKWVALITERQEKANKVPEEAFFIEYHLYEIKAKNVEEFFIEIEYQYDVLSMGYSGDTKWGDTICKDIYSYYGVTEEDIKNKTKRYQTLLSILAT